MPLKVGQTVLGETLDWYQLRLLATKNPTSYVEKLLNLRFTGINKMPC